MRTTILGLIQGSSSSLEPDVQGQLMTNKSDMTYPSLEGDGNALDRNVVLRTCQDDCGKSLVVF